jgi:hypothetical protein
MRHESDPNRKASLDQISPSIHDATDQIIEAMSPIFAAIGFGEPQGEPPLNEPLPQIDVETVDEGSPLGMDDLEALAGFEGLAEPAEPFPESEDLLVHDDIMVGFEGRGIQEPVSPQPSPQDFVGASSQDVVPAVAELDDPVDTTETVFARVVASPTAPEAKAPPLPSDPGLLFPSGSRSRAPFLQQGTPPPVSPDDTLGVAPPSPSRTYQATGAVVIDASLQEPAILRDPIGTLVDRQFTGGEVGEMEAYREVESAVDEFSFRTIETIRSIARLLLEQKARLDYIYDALSGEGVDEEL